MTMATDLLGLGVDARTAILTSTGGTGPLTGNAAGSTNTNAAKINASQYQVNITAQTAGGTGVILPSVGGETGAHLADAYVIHNEISGGVIVYAPSGVTLNVSGAQYSGSNGYTLAQFHTVTVYVQSTSKMFALTG